MSWVEYSSDDDAFDRRASWRRHDESDSSDSAKKGLRKASHRAKNQVKAAANDTETFVDSRKPQIAIAAAIAAGLAIAGLVVSKVRGSKDRTAGSDRKAVPPSVSEAQLTAATQPKKLSTRRKRSGYVPKWLVSKLLLTVSTRLLHNSPTQYNTWCRFQSVLLNGGAAVADNCLRQIQHRPLHHPLQGTSMLAMTMWRSHPTATLLQPLERHLHSLPSLRGLRPSPGGPPNALPCLAGTLLHPGHHLISRALDKPQTRYT